MSASTLKVYSYKESLPMKANYHTHTYRCHHAKGTEKEYVEKAIESGLKILGFSDHTPYPFPDPSNYCSGIRMGMDELEDYVTTILKLRDEYRNDIEIHLGLEVEYFPPFFDDLVKEAANYPIEYFLLAQHFLFDGKNGVPYSGTKTEDPSILKQYCAQVTEAMNTGLFTYVAHPDLVQFKGNPQLYDTEIRGLCQRAKALNLPLEINFLGIWENRHYPVEAFWKIAGEEGCDVIYGLDAHQPEAFDFKESLAKADQIVQRNHLHLLETVTLRKGW